MEKVKKSDKSSKRLAIILFYLILIVFSIYSYSLVDLNLTLFNHSLWENFRNKIIQIGYFQRNISSIIYLCLITILSILHLLIINTNLNPLKIALTAGSISFFSYPFLSYDFFNYIFDAKILTFYHKNPYTHKPLDFPHDPWLRFMHWTHRPYPYGPTWLFITLFPSFFSFGKFILNFFLFKLMFVFSYWITVYFLDKINRKAALFFATHPLVITEGLISPHNDLMAVCLGTVGIYYLFKSKNFLGRFFLILSAGIKYISLPFIFISIKNKKINYLILFSVVGVITYILLKMEIQPWYFLVFFIFSPFFYHLVRQLNIFLLGLLFSYYPYIRFEGWHKAENIILKHKIISLFLVINLLSIIFQKIFSKINHS